MEKNSQVEKNSWGGHKLETERKGKSRGQTKVRQTGRRNESETVGVGKE